MPSRKQKSEVENLAHLLLMQGIVTLVFGVLIFFFPKLSVGVFITFFAIMLLAIGGVSVLHALHLDEGESRAPFLIEGIIALGIGIYTFINPQLTGTIMVFLLAIWAFLSGVIKIIFSLAFPKLYENQLLVFVIGIVYAIFGIVLFRNPVGGVLALTGLIGFFGMITGIMQIIASFGVKNIFKNF